ncbi:MAG: hypothetical protein LUI87_05570 [Lachnospiraceae bacterium]|nr:hypothetical protein [Lachnospiraceae bacterium]
MPERVAEKRIHDAYLQCKTIFNPEEALLNDTVKIEDEEENLFYCIVSDFFIQQKQKEMIKR